MTSIGNQTFQDCSKFTSITIPAGANLSSIGSSAFQGCSGLKDIKILGNVGSIGSETFLNCSSLSACLISGKVTECASDAFAGCNITELVLNNDFPNPSAFGKKIQHLTLKENVTKIPDEAFKDCKVLSRVTIDDKASKLAYIGKSAFEGCGRLLTIRIPYNSKLTAAVYIGNSAFKDCKNLTNVDFGSNIPGIFDDSVFQNCSALTSITLPDKLASIGNSAFSGCSGLTSVNIPNSVRTLGANVFKGCTGLTTATIGSGVTSIPDNTFYGCRGLTSIDIPNSVKSIGAYAFYSTGLTWVVIPESVTSIGTYAFAICRELAEVINYSTVPQTIAISTFATYNATLYVKNGYRHAYEQADVWKNFTVKTIPTEVNPCVFEDGKDYNTASSELDYSKITYKRNFGHTNWQALYVPFTMSAEEWKGEFDVASVYNVIDYDDNEDGTFDRTYIVAKKITSGSLKPNHPYLIRAKQKGEKSLDINTTVLAPAEENSIDCSSTELKFTFTGTYQRIDGSVMFDNGFYAMNGGKLLKAGDEEAALNPQRWYMSVEDRYGNSAPTKAMAVQILVDDENTTEIERITALSPQQTSKAYDLTGRAVEAGARGISIINGKKVIR